MPQPIIGVKEPRAFFTFLFPSACCAGISLVFHWRYAGIMQALVCNCAPETCFKDFSMIQVEIPVNMWILISLHVRPKAWEVFTYGPDVFAFCSCV